MLEPGLLVGDLDGGAGDEAPLLVTHEAAHLPAVELGEGGKGEKHEAECQRTAHAHVILLERATRPVTAISQAGSGCDDLRAAPGSSV